MPKPTIPVKPKLIYTSKSVIGITISVAGIVFSTISNQPWINPDVAKAVALGGTVLAYLGSVDRPELFFRTGKMQEAAQQAASNLTIVEAAQTIQQGLKVAAAPAEERTGLAIDLLADFQKRLTNQDAVLAEIRAATTAQQFPPLVGYPDRNDLPASSAIGAIVYPNDPRQLAQMEAPPVQGWKPDPTTPRPEPPNGQSWEPDVTMANGEGELPLEDY